ARAYPHVGGSRVLGERLGGVHDDGILEPHRFEGFEFARDLPCRRQIPQAVEFNHDLDAITYSLADLLAWFQALTELRARDPAAPSVSGRHIKRRYFHSSDAVLEQPLRECVRPVHERVEVFIRSRAARFPVRERPKISGSDVLVSCTGVVDGKAV